MAGHENDEGATKRQQKQIKASKPSSVVILSLNWHTALHFARHNHNADRCALEKRSRFQTKVCLIYYIYYAKVGLKSLTRCSARFFVFFYFMCSVLFFPHVRGECESFL